jgi:hypothetical protein
MPKVDCKPNKIYHFNQPTWIAHLSKRLNDLLLKVNKRAICIIINSYVNKKKPSL